jgi:hypothetical protein
MSARRKHGPRVLPPHIRDAARRSRCPDCSSEVTVRWDKRLGVWRTNVAYDDECPQLQWRQRHGAITGAMLVAETGSKLDPGLVAEVLSDFQKATGADAMRVSMDPTSSGVGWREREAIDEWGQS